MNKSRVEPTIFFIEKLSFSLKLFSGHFYGQSFIKTVRGPCTDKLYVVQSVVTVPVTGLFLCCHERDFMLSFIINQAGVTCIEVFNSTSKYINDLLNIDNPLFLEERHIYM